MSHWETNLIVQSNNSGFSTVTIRIPDLDDVNVPLIRIDCNSCVAPDVNALVHSHTYSIGLRQRQSIFVCCVKPRCDFRREILLENPYEDSTPFFYVPVCEDLHRDITTMENLSHNIIPKEFENRVPYREPQFSLRVFLHGLLICACRHSTSSAGGR